MTTFVMDKNVSKEETTLWLQNHLGMDIEALMPKSMIDTTKIIKKSMQK